MVQGHPHICRKYLSTIPLLSKWLRVFSRFESNLKRYIRENGLKPEDPLFNITDRQVRNLIKKHAKKAGIPQP
ncbi:MAG: hypothetical protein QXH85_04565 [Candidatus Bathyarchaeia archaeon]